MARKSSTDKNLKQQALPLFWDEPEDEPADPPPPAPPAEDQPEPTMSRDDANPTDPDLAAPEPSTPPSNSQLKIVKPADEHSPSSDPMITKPTGFLLEDTQDRIPPQATRPKTEPGKKSGLILKKKAETDSHQPPATVTDSPPTTTAGKVQLPIRTQPTITLPVKDSDDEAVDPISRAREAATEKLPARPLSKAMVESGKHRPLADDELRDDTDDDASPEAPAEATPPRPAIAAADSVDDSDDAPVKPKRPLVAKPVVAVAAAAADSVADRPAVAKPLVAKPNVAKPDAPEPPAEKPVVSKPLVAKPNVPKTTDDDKPPVKKPLVTKPDVAKPQVASDSAPTDADLSEDAAPAPAAAVVDDGLGGRLRLAREDRGLTPQQVADTTHIRADLIALLEKRAYDQMPVAAVYTRSYIKTLCKLYELDATDFLADLDEHLAKRGDSSLAATTHIQSKSMFSSEPEEKDKTTSGLTYAFVGLAIVVLVLLLAAIAKSLFFGGPRIDGIPSDVPADAIEEILPPEMLNLRELPVPGEAPPSNDSTTP